jgi:hypothetical protein
LSISSPLRHQKRIRVSLLHNRTPRALQTIEKIHIWVALVGQVEVRGVEQGVHKEGADVVHESREASPFHQRLSHDLVRLAGNVSSLTIQRSAIHREWNSYFRIEIRAGSGMESGSWTMDKAAMGDLAQTIHDSCDMYEASMSTVSGLVQKS